MSQESELAQLQVELSARRVIPEALKKNIYIYIYIKRSTEYGYLLGKDAAVFSMEKKDNYSINSICRTFLENKEYFWQKKEGI